MADWLNHVTISGPRNGTTSHTVDPNGGTVVAGANFLPTAGRFLLATAYGGVTSTTPAGWTLPTNGSAVNNGGLYVWYKASAAGSDTFSTTHNGSNYPIEFDIYEFPSGTTFKQAQTAINVASGGAGPSLTSLTGTNWLAAIAGRNHGSDVTTYTTTWSAGTELVDYWITGAGGTDGYTYSLAALDSSALTTWSSAATMTGSGTGTIERLVVAVTPGAAGAADTTPNVHAPRGAVQRAANW